MQLRKKILNLDEGLNVYSQLLKDEEAILIPFAISLYVTACRIDELIPEYLADLDRNECQESLGIDFEQITGVDYWTGKLTKLRSDMERLGSVPMKEHGFVVNILDFCPETTTDLCRAIEQKVMQMVEMLKEVERRLAEAPAELYGNFYRSQKALCNARPVKVRFERWKREVAVVTLELLKDKQMLEVVEFLKKKVLRHAPLPSERERCRVDLDTLRSHLPPPLRPYFWENAHNSFASKDDHLALSENCLVEIEEIDLQNPRDISELKALATSEKIKERRPYARFREEKHRLASFCGSGNQQRFLSDDTGNRRWLCFKVSHIDDPRQWGIDYDQLYAQLRDELRQGFRYWFDADEQRRVERQNGAFRIESDEEQLIRTRLRPPGPTDPVTLMNAAGICQFVNGGSVGRGLSTRKVSLAMGKLGFKTVHTKTGNFYQVYQIPPNEIQPTLATALDEAASEADGSPEWQESELPF